MDAAAAIAKLSQSYALAREAVAPAPFAHTFAGVPVSIERPPGYVQQGIGDDGRVWTRVYGYDRETGARVPGFVGYGCIPGTAGLDGEDLDVYLGDAPDADTAYLILQGEPDPEHKLMLGWPSAQAAADAYTAHVPREMLSAIMPVPVDLVRALLAGRGEVAKSCAPGEGERERMSLATAVRRERSRAATKSAMTLLSAAVRPASELSPAHPARTMPLSGVYEPGDPNTGWVGWIEMQPRPRPSPRAPNFEKKVGLANSNAYGDWIAFVARGGDVLLWEFRYPDGSVQEEPGPIAFRREDLAVAGPTRDLQKAEWSTAFVNDLPDSAFLYIEPGGAKDEGGRTRPRALRHFPYRGADGEVDLPHLRNALSRIPQAGDWLSASDRDRLVERARELLDRASKSGGAGRDEFMRDLRAAGPPDEWSGAVAAMLGDRAAELRALWDSLGEDERQAVRDAFAASFARKDATLITKAFDDELRYVCGIVLEPLDPARGEADTQGDAYSEEEIRLAMWHYMTHFRNISLHHKAFLNGRVNVVECWQAKEDQVIEGTHVRKGAWLLGVHIPDDEIWDLVKRRELKAFSIGGTAERVPVQRPAA